LKRLIITAPRKAEFEDVELPACPRDGLVVRASVTAISTGTEIRVYRLIPVDQAGKYLHANIPMEVPAENGYSMVGEVIETGDQVTGFEVGQRVFVPATHRHVAAVAAGIATKVPAGVTDEQAVFAAILEVAHLAIRRGEPTPGETMAVIGLGIIGLSALAYGKAYGFRTLAIDKAGSRLQVAKAMGADCVLNPDAADFSEQVHAFTGGYGVDLVIEAASAWPAIQTGMEIAAQKGKIVVVARHTDQPNFSPVGDPYLQKDLTLLVSYGHPPPGHRWERQRAIDLTLEMLGNGRLQIEPMITHRIPWHELPAIYARLDQGDQSVVGVVANWQS
jgi:2-desacetyl-2-hydroxyethyl bacteriochlorophyllide A dehydrogenase